jgi:hypothetical protein
MNPPTSGPVAAPQLASQLANTLTDALVSGEAALRSLAGVAPRDHRDRAASLLTIYDLHMAPLETVRAVARWQGHPAVADIKTRLEGQWLAELEASYAAADIPAAGLDTVTVTPRTNGPVPSTFGSPELDAQLQQARAQITALVANALRAAIATRAAVPVTPSPSLTSDTPADGANAGTPGSSTSSPAPSASPSSTPGDQLPSFPRTTTSSAAPSATPSGGARTGQSSREPALTAAPTTAGASTSTPTPQPTPTPTPHEGPSARGLGYRSRGRAYRANLHPHPPHATRFGSGWHLHRRASPLARRQLTAFC